VPPQPTTIGPFRVESLLGAGGMGEVYKAVDPTLGRTVAVKIVKADSTDSQYFKRLLREAQAYGRLKHPNIVTVYEAREAADGLYIAMEYLEGQSLTTVLNRDELSLAARIDVLIQILDALKYAHAQGIVHRDIKPSNIHVLADGTVKLLDFGLARVMRTETLTATDVVLGTPHYASPEQLKGEEVDGRTDVYSTGVVAFEMLTRRRPFNGNSLGTIVAKVLSEPTPPMDTPWSRNFPELEQIVQRAMAKSAAERYAGAAEMQQALKEFQTASQAALRGARDATTRVPATPVSNDPTVLQPPEPRTVRIDAPPIPPTAAKREPVSPPPPRAQPVSARPEPAPRPPAPSSQPAPTTTSSKRPVAMWLGALGALAGLVILSVVVGQRRAENRARTEQPITSTTTTIASTSLPAVAPERSQGAKAGGSGGPNGSGGSGGSESRGPSEPNGPRNPRGSVDGQTRSTGGSPLPGAGSQGQTDVRAVYIDPTGDAALNRELVNALTGKGVTTVTTAVRARMAINARIEISIRPAPIGGTSALTADFVATLQMRDATTGKRETRSIDGHALDFGEAVVRQAAYKRAAEQLAEAIDTAMRN
jgi:serine/threonine protein kinase